MIAGGAKAARSGHRGQGSGGRSSGASPSAGNARSEPSSFSRQGSKGKYGGLWPQQQQQQGGEDDDDDDPFGDLPKVDVEEDEGEDEEDVDDDGDWEDVVEKDGVYGPRSVNVNASSSSSSAFDNNREIGSHNHSHGVSRPDGGASTYPADANDRARDGRGNVRPGSTTQQSRPLQTQFLQVMTVHFPNRLISSHIAT